jgi:hypothetical protein
MSFKDITIKTEYRSGQSDVIRDFYIPILSQAVLYKRAVGFFSSTALIQISKGLVDLVANGGRVQLIASPRLSVEDIEAIKKGYEEREKVIERVLLNSFEQKKTNKKQVQSQMLMMERIPVGLENVKKTLDMIDPNRLTPIEALQLVMDLKTEVNKKD